MKNLKLFAGLLIGSVAYCYLMWYQHLGLNAVIFAALLILSVFLCRKDLRNNTLLKCLAGVFFLSAVSVTVNGIIFSMVMYYISLVVFISFVQIPSLRFLFFAFISFLLNIPKSIKLYFKMIKDALVFPFAKKENGEKINSRNAKALFSRILIASIFVLIFLGLFLTANAQFKKLAESAFNPLFDFLGEVFSHISFLDIFHFAFIVYFLSLFFLSFEKNAISNYDNSCKNNFVREKIRFYQNGLSVKLKDEYKTALLSISLINILLLLVNCTDIFTVWLGQIPETAGELSTFVHHGTYLLILSVLISVGIILYFFRDNLNLYSKNKNLKFVSTAWIIQNAFLLLSVGLRNFHYVTQCGLTYKRIGVFIFLFIVGLGLFFLYLKIRNKKTFYYYNRVCGWGILGTLLFAGFFNWDVIICKYNTSQSTVKIDYNYMRSDLSSQAYPYVYKDKDDYPFCVDEYMTEMENRDWQSFNFGDYWAVEKLKK